MVKRGDETNAPKKSQQQQQRPTSSGGPGPGPGVTKKRGGTAKYKQLTGKPNAKTKGEQVDRFVSTYRTFRDMCDDRSRWLLTLRSWKNGDQSVRDGGDDDDSTNSRSLRPLDIPKPRTVEQLLDLVIEKQSQYLNDHKAMNENMDNVSDLFYSLVETIQKYRKRKIPQTTVNFLPLNRANLISPIRGRPLSVNVPRIFKKKTEEETPPPPPPSPSLSQPANPPGKGQTTGSRRGAAKKK